MTSPKRKPRKGSTKATGRDYAKDKKYQASPERKRYRAELNQYNRKRGTYGNGDGLDATHRGGKIVGMEPQSANRARKTPAKANKRTSLKKK